MHPLKELINKNKSGVHTGVCSVCSSNEFVIEAAMEEAKKSNSMLLVEATANQVNQFGGYTGLTPDKYCLYVKSIAERVKYPYEKVILGGDHLGPLTWQSDNADTAMEKAKTLIKEFVSAGFSKIHIDTSMKLADDPHGKLSSKTIAERGAVLCEAAEEVVKEKGLERPVYILGSEVPIPGGAQTNEELTVTSKEDFLETIRFFKESFEAHKLTEAWKNVIAFVVQPGVEFGAFSVHDYEPAKAKELSAKIAEIDGIAFEGHSTDYQSEESLKELVDDHVAILKVGPALTFALREGLESLESIEKELLDGKTELSNFSQTLEKAMTDDPTNWIKHYKFGSEKNKIARKFSYSDRCRYYLGDENVEKAIDRLFKNLDGKEIPMPIISRYFPTAYWKVRSGEIKPVPRELAKARIKDTLDIYYSAVN